MNELFDKLIIRLIFSAFLLAIIFLYKYIHIFLYPAARSQVFKRVLPSKNSPETLHFFSRLIGPCIIYADFHLSLSNGPGANLIIFLIEAILAFSFYLMALYVIDSVVLYQFEYSDEILKRKNYTYSLVSLAHSLGIAWVIKTVFSITARSPFRDSIITLTALFLLILASFGLLSKTYSLISKLSFHKNMSQKNLALGFSYLGFYWSISSMIGAALSHPLFDIKWYIIQFILKIILSAMVFPVFAKGLGLIFGMKNDLELKENQDALGPVPGYGIYEGGLLFTAGLLTAIIVGQIRFGNYYPNF